MTRRARSGSGARQSLRPAVAWLALALACSSLETGEVNVVDDAHGGSAGAAGEGDLTGTRNAGGTTTGGLQDLESSTSAGGTKGGAPGDNDDSATTGGSDSSTDTGGAAGSGGSSTGGGNTGSGGEASSAGGGPSNGATATTDPGSTTHTTTTETSGGDPTSSGGATSTESSTETITTTSTATSGGDPSGPTSSTGGATSTTSSTETITTSTTGSGCPDTCSGGQTCEAGTCECPEHEPEWCSEECVDVLTDPDHCGRCEHSCHGGTCSDGRCDAITLASGRTAPWELAVNEDGVYWLEEDAVLATPLDGGVIVTLAGADDVGQPSSIAASATTVYYVNSGDGAGCTCFDHTVMEVPTSGGADPREFAHAQLPWGVTYSNGVVYWCDRGAEIIYSAEEGNGDDPYEVFVGGFSIAPPPYDMVVDASSVYWGDYLNRVYKNGLSSGYDLSVLDESEFGDVTVYQLALGGGYVYWTTGEPTTPRTTTPLNSSLSKVPIEGGELIPVASSLTLTPALAVDEIGVYWSDGNIKRTPHDGSPAETLVQGENAGFMALDDEFVYWTDATSGKVMKVAK